MKVFVLNKSIPFEVDGSKYFADNPKTGKMARFAMEFPFQFLDFSIEISKDWNGNSKSKRVVIPGL